MKDWDAHLMDAAEAAEKEAETPIVRSILEIFSHNGVLPANMSDERVARLLDIAILCGDYQLAVNLAQSFSVRPLRRWSGGCDLAVLSAALWAGADFQDLHVQDLNPYGVNLDVPLLLDLALDFDSEDWQQLGHFFSSKPRWPSSDVQLGLRFLSIHGDGYLWISMDKVHSALRSGWDLKYIWDWLFDGNQLYAAGLLDLAILGGKSDCADALATAGVELREDCLELLKRACRGESVQHLRYLGDPPHVGSALECKAAASAAALASLRRSFRHQGVEKGADVYEVLLTKFQQTGQNGSILIQTPCAR